MTSPRKVSAILSVKASAKVLAMVSAKASAIYCLRWYREGIDDVTAIVYPAAPVVVCLIKSIIITIGTDIGEDVGEGIGDGVSDNVGADVGDGIRLRPIAPLGFCNNFNIEILL